MSYSFQYANQTEEDDLYSGYNQAPTEDFSPYNPQMDQGGYQGGAPPGTQGLNRQPPPQSRGGAPPMSRQMQSSMGGQQGDARPMTAVRAAGYTASGNRPASRGVFDPAGLAGRGPAPPLQKRSENSPEDMCREMEKDVNRLIEESAQLNLEKNYSGALEKAKEAGKMERQLCKQREQAALVEQINIDLTYSVCFNLANQYHANGLYTEALTWYSQIVKNKQYAQSGRLRVNMGNIYYEQHKYSNAIKMYRMALDQIPNTGKEIRFKIMRNIGNAFVRLGQFQDAMHSYEQIMDGSPDVQTGFNLLLCYYALGEKEKMKKCFSKLLSIKQPGTEDELESSLDDVLKEDGLKEAMRERQKSSQRYISIGAKLLAPVLVAEDAVAGFDWVVEGLRSQSHFTLAMEMEIAKSLHFMRSKQFDKAIETLKSYEKKDQQLVAQAATNLSFIYFHEGDHNNAIKYADLAMRHNRYNAKALVNKGNCLFMRGDLEMAKTMYQESMSAEADCIEALYNLGLVNKKMNLLGEALQLFEKLHMIVPHSIEVTYQIASLYDAIGNSRQALKWFNILSTRVPTDPGVSAKMGYIYLKEDDEAQAFHYHLESYRYFPVDMKVISWLGAYFVKNEVYEKAVQYFQRAAEIEPQEVKWKLMVASCHRRSGDYQQAFEIYESIHREYPDNIECLRYLVHICDDLGKKDQVHDYVVKLRKAERAVDQQQGVATSQQMAPTAAPPMEQQQQQQQPQPQQQQQQQQPQLDENMFTAAALLPNAGTDMRPPPTASKKPLKPNEDEWGDEDLGDDLLPQ